VGCSLQFCRCINAACYLSVAKTPPLLNVFTSGLNQLRSPFSLLVCFDVGGCRCVDYCHNCCGSEQVDAYSAGFGTLAAGRDDLIERIRITLFKEVCYSPY
jgi:hypothetical protein